MTNQKRTFHRLDHAIRAIYTLAGLMEGYQSSEGISDHLLHGCARVLKRECETALEQMDQLRDNF